MLHKSNFGNNPFAVTVVGGMTGTPAINNRKAKSDFESGKGIKAFIRTKSP